MLYNELVLDLSINKFKICSNTYLLTICFWLNAYKNLGVFLLSFKEISKQPSASVNPDNQ